MHGFSATVHGRVEEWGLAARLAISAAFAGFLGLMAQVSFPVPWTPVPFSLTPFALMLVGGFQKPWYAVLSVAMYLAAGAVGLPVFAEGSSGFQHLIGRTGGYLIGYMLVAGIVSAYLQQSRRTLPTRWVAAVMAFLATAVVAGIATIAWMWRTGSGLEATWGVGASTMWVLLFVTGVCAAGSIWSLRRSRGQTSEALSLYLVMLGAIAVLHACGVTVLWAMTPLTLMQAIALGSIVFLPFDLIKAGLAVGFVLPFLPPKPEESA